MNSNPSEDARPWLLDVNLLLAWLWPPHEFHRPILEWVTQHAGEPWATCPLTELGFLHIICSPALSSLTPTIAEARSLLEEQKGPDSGHKFWAADLSCQDTGDDFLQKLTGHKQITDAYLLSLAVKNNGILVTRDRRIRFLPVSKLALSFNLLILP